MPYETGNFLFKEEYVGLLANFDGLVKNINKSGLPKKNFNSVGIEEDSILYIDNVLGRYINKGDIVCYCSKRHENVYQDTSKYFRIDRKVYRGQFAESILCLCNS